VTGIALLCALGAASYTFGGFEEGEAHYLKRGARDEVCAPPAADCRPVDKKTARGFVKPARTRKLGGAALAVTVRDDTRIELAAGDRVLGTAAPGGRVVAVNANVFVSPGGGLVAVEYDAARPGGKVSDVIVFDVSAAPAPAGRTLPPARPAEGPASAYMRALGRGGVWEQRLEACDQAGVHLELAKTRHFDLRIVTKCQGHKDDTRLAGTWATEGNDVLVLSFPNEDGPEERLECRFLQCTDDPEDCLLCQQDDVSFTLQIVRR